MIGALLSFASGPFESSAEAATLTGTIRFRSQANQGPEPAIAPGDTTTKWFTGSDADGLPAFSSATGVATCTAYPGTSGSTTSRAPCPCSAA